MNRRDWLIMALLVCAAAALRIPGLEALPPALWFDEGLNGVDALAIADGGPWPLVFTGVFPREPMLIYPMALLIRIFGPETFTLRLASALVGTLAPPLLYAWLRKAATFKTALFAALFLITFRWHLHFSRIALRTIWTPTLTCAFFAVLWTAFQTGRKKWVAIAGGLLGSGVYAYLSWYFFLPVGLLTAILGFRKSAPQQWRQLTAILLVGMFIICGPMWIHYLITPSDATGRTSELSLFKEGIGPAVQQIAINARDAALMFFVRGDHVPKHNIPLKPALEPFGAILFIIGFIRILITLRTSLLSLSLLLYLVACAMPTVFSRTDSANFLRTLIETSAIAATVGFGAEGLFQYLQRRQLSRRLAHAIPVCLLVASMLSMLFLYFHAWPRVPLLKQNFSGDADDMARYVRSVPSNTLVYVPSAMAVETYNFRFLTARCTNLRVYRNASELPPKGADTPTIVIESPSIDPRATEVIAANHPASQLVHEFLTVDASGQQGAWARAWRLQSQ